MLKGLAGITILVGVAFLAAVWWPEVQSRTPPPPPRPEAAAEAPAAGTAGPAEPAPAPRPPPAREPAESGPPSLSDARAWEDLDQPGKAIEMLDAILEREPENVEALYLRGRAHLRLAMPRLAERDFRAAVDLEPTAERLVALADVIKLRDPEGALGQLRKAEELEPKLARIHSLMARIHYRQGRIEEARRATERALEEDPADDLALRMREQLR